MPYVPGSCNSKSKRVYSRHTKNHDILDISVGDGSPRGGAAAQLTIQRRSYEELDARMGLRKKHTH